MGHGRWSEDDWDSYATTNSYATKKTEDIFKTTASSFAAKGLDTSVDPRNATRESRDSADNPNSTAIIVGVDVTGSMGMLADKLVRTGLNTLVTAIYDRKPVSDPHILAAAIGDVEHDKAPFQITQFEADIKILPQIEHLWLEKGGGGNSYESYALAWYFAAMHTQIDCFAKRGKKGYLFTMGDENPTPVLRKDDLCKVFGAGPERDLYLNDLLTMASRQWEIFHLVVEEGSYGDRPLAKWQEVLGQRALRLSDYTKMSEVIVSAIQVLEGEAHDKVVKSWDGSTSIVVANAINSLTPAARSASGGVVSL